MVIEIDRKKVAKAKRVRWLGVAYGLLALLHIYTIVDNLRHGHVVDWFNIASVLMWLILAVFIWQRVRRALRHRRTDHHLYIDESGVTMINGHARVDIPWDDVEKISIGGRNRAGRPHSLKIQLRKDTPYNKRTYRLYDDYERSLDELQVQINEMWSAGNIKLKLLTI